MATTDAGPVSSDVGVRLRRVREQDLRWMAEMTIDPVAVGEHNWAGVPRDLSEVEAGFRADFAKDEMAGSTSGMLIVELTDGTPIGDVSWRTERWGPSQESRCRAFGIGLLPEFRGRGYGTAAQRLLIDHLFVNTTVHRVQSDTAVDNPAEQRALRKVGMREEGTVRGAEFRNGAYVDHILFAILRPEWESNRAHRQ